jgi:hypothetical protein
MADTNPSTIRRVMEQLVSHFFCLHRDAAMIARDSSNSDITAGSSCCKGGAYSGQWCAWPRLSANRVTQKKIPGAMAQI